MPRIAGVNLVAWLAGAITIYFIGFLIYGVTLSEVWANENLRDHGVFDAYSKLSAADQATFQVPGSFDMTTSMSLGFVIELVTALGLCIAQGIMKPKSIVEALRNGFVLWIGFSVTSLAYGAVYGSFSRVNFGIDALHTFLDYLAASAVIFLLDGKALSGMAATGMSAKPAA